MSQSTTCLGSLFSQQKKSPVPGLLLAHNAITPEQETELLRFVDSSSEPWTTRRTRKTKNYGPYYLYSERDTPEGRFRYTDGVVRHAPLPPFLDETIMPIVTRALPQLRGWRPNQLHVALYRQKDDGRIRMHNDNKMGDLGPFIVGMCMLSDTAMTFVRPRDGRKRVVPLPRRCVYAMTGEAHFEWRHGILSGATPTNRVSFTLREVRKLAVEEGAKVKQSRHAPTQKSIQQQREKDERRAQGIRSEPEPISLASMLT